MAILSSPHAGFPRDESPSSGTRGDRTNESNREPPLMPASCPHVERVCPMMPLRDLGPKGRGFFEYPDYIDVGMMVQILSPVNSLLQNKRVDYLADSQVMSALSILQNREHLS